MLRSTERCLAHDIAGCLKLGDLERTDTAHRFVGGLEVPDSIDQHRRTDKQGTVVGWCRGILGIGIGQSGKPFETLLEILKSAGYALH